MHDLALELGRTVGELAEVLTFSEWLAWLDYFADRAEDDDRRRRRAKGEVRTDDPNAGAQLLASIGKAPPGKAPRTRRDDAGGA